MAGSTSGPGADRNLLFGVLALQMDFVGRDALIGALHAWLLDKAKPLGQLLVERGDLTPQRRELLEALVREHLAQHGSDAVHALSTLGIVPAVRPDLESLGDADVQASLDSLDAFCPPAPVPAPAVGQPTSAGRRFHVLRLHARGGLGQVSVALDQELHREVALKEIQPQFADHPEGRNRFLLEAEITGRLEHPGIVPVYGLGRHPDGRPFYAMRFINGGSLEEEIGQFHAADGAGRKPGERALALRGLLGRFIDVCNAVAYAHSRGIVHRDLKPANIMLGPYGETLVVDWGLAKPMEDRPDDLPRSLEGTLRPLLGRDSDQTRLGAVVGTPAYMSPEQAAGRSEHVGAASDVYSLGGTLYCLLTGRPPFEGTNLLAILERVTRGEVVPPRRANRSVPAALEAVCLKAMALRPEDRYASPRELADEIERWLGDEPVRAHREPLPARLRRWGRRHRPLVTGATALLLTAVLALGVGVVMLGRSHRETEKALRLAREKEKQAGEAERRADDNARTARAQREAAFGALKSLVADVASQLRSPDGADAPLDRDAVLYLRRQLLDHALPQLIDLARTAEADQYLVRPNLEMGDLLRAAGKVREARLRYEEGRRLAERQVAAAPRDREARLALVQALARLGDLALRRHDWAAARKAHEEALAVADSLVKESSADLGPRRAQLHSRLKLGEADLGDGRAAEALRSFQEALKLAEALAFYGGPNALPNHATAHTLVGDAQLALGRPESALGAYQAALALDRKHQGFNKESSRARRRLAASLVKVGKAHLLLGEPEKAAEAHAEALPLYQALAVPPPSNVAAQLEAVDARAQLAAAQREALELERAGDDYHEAAAEMLRLHEEGRLADRPRWRDRLKELLVQEMECRRAERAAEDLGYALRHSTQRAELLSVRARALAKQGKHVEAAEAAGHLAGLPSPDGKVAYDAARCFAACFAAVGRGRKPAEWTEAEREQRRGHAEKALEQLRRARDAGWFREAGRARVAERELAPLRGQAGVDRLLAEVRGKG